MGKRKSIGSILLELRKGTKMRGRRESKYISTTFGGTTYTFVRMQKRGKR